MNGGADLGGMMGFGPVIDESQASDVTEPNFHAHWESRVMGMAIAMGACGTWNIDQSRFARETLPPASYMQFSYYRIWLEGLIKLLQDHDMVSAEEINQGTALEPAAPIKRKLLKADVQSALKAGGPADRPQTHPAAFQTGQLVRTINKHPQSHTRLPRYARDKIGIVSKVFGVHVYPDSSAQGLGENPQWLYQIQFKATALWGDDKNPQDTVSLDLWEPYLVLHTSCDEHE